MTRTVRLLAMTELLRARRTGITAAEIAEHFGVTLRTVYRDLAALKVAELPLRADRGRGGGYALDRSYTLPPVNFTAREAAVLIAAGEWLSTMRVLPFANTLSGAVHKLRAALGERGQRELERQLDRIDFVGVPAHDVAPRAREAIERAFFERRPVELTYRGARRTDALRTRLVRIESIVMDRSETLLNTVDTDTGDERQLRLHRIEQAIVQ